MQVDYDKLISKLANRIAQLEVDKAILSNELEKLKEQEVDQDGDSKADSATVQKG